MDFKHYDTWLAIGLNILYYRKEKGLTQMQLAKMCDVKQPAIARIESLTHSPQVDSLLRILVPLGYTLQIVPIQSL